MFDAIPAEMEELATTVLDAAFRVHQELGPGLLESAYETCLCYEFEKNGIRYEKQKLLPVVYDRMKLDAGYRLDILVSDSIVLELKSVEQISSLHETQLQTYLKLSGIRLGFLMNFNVEHFKDGLKWVVL